MKLALTESIDQERARFANIASTNPEKAKAIYAIGESMKTYSSSGELSKFRRLINETPKEDILIYFTSKAFEAAINAGNLIISSFMVDQGYPLNSEALPSSMHSAIQTLEDDTCVPVLHFLISKGANVNRQLERTWLSPLHLAVKRCQPQSVIILVNAGADVNCVAEMDMMPLTIADSLPSSEGKDLIIDILERSGAKRTWRKDSQILFQQTAFGTFSTHAATSTSISAKHSDPKVSFSAQHMPQPVVVQPKSSMVRFTAGGPVTQAIPSASKAFGNDAVEVDVSISGIGSYSIAEDGAKIFCTGN